jgi:CDGSH-type Zn-finger protein
MRAIRAHRSEDSGTRPPHEPDAPRFADAYAGTASRMNSPERHEPAATVTAYEDGPLLVRGDFVLMTPDGDVIEPGRATVALCRCGKSAIKPFCDGTHKVINFRTDAGRDRA